MSQTQTTNESKKMANQINVIRTIKNYTEKNIVGQIVDWSPKPGRLVSISYICENGYVAVKNCRDPHLFTTDFFKGGKCVTGQFRSGKISVDWSTKKTAVKSTRMVPR